MHFAGTGHARPWIAICGSRAEASDPVGHARQVPPERFSTTPAPTVSVTPCASEIIWPVLYVPAATQSAEAKQTMASRSLPVCLAELAGKGSDAWTCIALPGEITSAKALLSVCLT